VHDRTNGDETQSLTPRRDTWPRVLLVSQRNLSDQVANACLYQFEDLLCTLDDVDLIAPGRSVILPGKLYKLARWCGVPRQLARAVTLRPQVAEPAREYELLIAVLDSYRQVATVNTIKQWRRHCHKAICFFPEIWPRDIDTRNSLLELFDVFDHIFVGVDHCSEALTKLIGRPCTNLHPAVDALQFCPRPSIRRSIDVCYIGRRSEVTHQRLLALAEDKELFYYYDTAKGSLRIADHRAHRLLFANLVKRSRYFIANYAKIDRPDQTGGKQEVGYRFFEGVAGGAVLLGQPPATAAFRRLFPWPDAVIEIPFDAPGVVEVIAGLDGDPARTARIRAANVANALRLHDWVYRYEEMLAVAGLASTPAMADRQARLQALADRFEHAPCDEAAAAPHRIPA